MIAILQHGKDEGPGLISDLFGKAVNECRTIHVYGGEMPGETLPKGLIILGGPMSASDTSSYPEFLIEHEMIRRMVALERPVLGICLGAQLIAAAFGAAVFPAPVAERGWFWVFRMKSHADSIIPDAMNVFQWHNDTFDLPAGAKLIARGDAVPHQMFSLGSAIGVQFHPEVTGEMVDIWTKSLQPEERAGILGDTTRKNLEQNRGFCEKLLRPFLEPRIPRQKEDHRPVDRNSGLPMETG